MTIEKQKLYDTLYMDIADRVACMSYAKRRKCGCVVVKGDQIISMGWNGTPSGDPNDCEDILPDGTMVTKPEVLHAEENALGKITKSTESSTGAVMYVTLSPCLICARRIKSSGIVEVVYKEYYVSATGGDGIEYLSTRNVKVRQIKY